MKQHKLLAFNLFKFKVDSRYRVKFCLYLFAYSFGIALCISKTNHLIVITDAKY